MNPSELILAEKYRPKTIEECILPADLKNLFLNYVKTGKFPNLLLTGGPGVGKTTVARALASQLNADYLFINASKDGTIDNLRTTIQQFASTMSLSSSSRKIVQLDEADYLTHHFQPALRAFTEEFAENCVFILTANYPNRLMAPLLSRFEIIDFKIPASEKKQLLMETYKRVCDILNQENMSYDKEVVANLVSDCFPDIRSILTKINRYLANGSVDIAILADEETDWDNLFGHIKTKNFTEARKWIAQHSDIDTANFFRKLYTDLSKRLSDDSIPVLVMIIAKYQYQAAFVADQEINSASCIVEIMAETSFR